MTGNSRKGKDLGGRGWCAQGKVGRRKRLHLSHPLSMHGPLRLVTSHSRFALAPMRNRESLKRRQAVSYDYVVKSTVACVLALARPVSPSLLLLNACHTGYANCESRLKDLFKIQEILPHRLANKDDPAC